MTPDEAAARFLRFAEIECGTSPLYQTLSRIVAADAFLLALAARARPGQPVPNLLFAAVHFLLLGGVTHPLSSFYPSLGGTETGNPASEFRDFCAQYEKEIGELLKTRRVQTNEVRRCAILLPAFAQMGNSLTLVEIGTSAGLNLLWDKYAYEYGGAGNVGTGALTLTCEARGKVPIPETMPTVTGRVGLDLNPISVTDPDAVAWLRALIWPEHKERMERLTQAVEIVKHDPPELRAGDALDLLPQAMTEASNNAILTVFHSFTVNQFSPEMQGKLAETFRQQSQKREFFVVSLESGTPHANLTLMHWKNETPTQKTLADADPHGAWLEWRQD